jgi:hypothetical protein
VSVRSNEGNVGDYGPDNYTTGFNNSIGLDKAIFMDHVTGRAAQSATARQ